MIREALRKWLFPELTEWGQLDLRCENLPVEEGSLLVLSTEAHLSNEQAKKLSERINSALSSKGVCNPVLLLHDGFKMHSIKPEDLEEQLREPVLDIIKKDAYLNGPTFRVLKGKIND